MNHLIPIAILLIFFLAGLPKKKLSDKVEYVPEPDNMERKSIYLAKRIMDCASTNELQYWQLQVNDFENTYMDYPDLLSELDELNDALQMKANELAVEEMQIKQA